LLYVKTQDENPFSGGVTRDGYDMINEAPTGN